MLIFKLHYIRLAKTAFFRYYEILHWIAEGIKDRQPLDDIFIGGKTFYALSDIRTHVPLITGWV